MAKLVKDMTAQPVKRISLLIAQSSTEIETPPDSSRHPSTVRTLKVGDLIAGDCSKVVIQRLSDDGAVAHAWCYGCKSKHAIDRKSYLAGGTQWTPIN